MNTATFPSALPAMPPMPALLSMAMVAQFDRADRQARLDSLMDLPVPVLLSETCADCRLPFPISDMQESFFDMLCAECRAERIAFLEDQARNEARREEDERDDCDRDEYGRVRIYRGHADAEDYSAY